MTQITQLKRQPAKVEALAAMTEGAPQAAELAPNPVVETRTKLENLVREVCGDGLKDLGQTAKRTQALMEAIIKRRDALLAEIMEYAEHVEAAVDHNKIVQESLEHITNYFPEVKKAD